MPALLYNIVYNMDEVQRGQNVDLRIIFFKTVKFENSIQIMRKYRLIAYRRRLFTHQKINSSMKSLKKDKSKFSLKLN